jgi:hypothetical protein
METHESACGVGFSGGGPKPSELDLEADRPAFHAMGEPVFS